METNVEVPIPSRAADPTSPVFVHVSVATGDQNDHFLQALLATPLSEKKPRKPLKLAASFALHLLIVGGLVLVPLYFSDVIDLKAYRQTLLVAPPSPAPPPLPIEKIVGAVEPPHITHLSQFTAPTVVPKTVVVAKDATPPEDLAGGISGNAPSGVLGGIIGGTGSAPVAPPPPSAPVASTPRLVHVGGDVKAPALIQSVNPRYPPLARTAHVEGDVVIDAVIDEQGNIVQAHAISGPALLIAAALQAVEQWKYQPTVLNGQTVSVAMHVTVTFRLNHGI